MPPEAPAQLRRILAQPEFQPRSRGVSWREYARVYAARIIKKAREWIGSLAPEIERDTRLGRLLERVALWFLKLWAFLRAGGSFLVWAGGLLVLALIALAVYRQVRKRLDRRVPTRVEEGVTPEETAVVWPLLQDLHARGEWRGLLAGIRRMFRERCLLQHRIPLSETDRGALRRLQGRDSQLPLFEGIVRAFERCAYARGAVDRAEVESIFTRFSQVVREQQDAAQVY